MCDPRRTAIIVLCESCRLVSSHTSFHRLSSTRCSPDHTTCRSAAVSGRNSGPLRSPASACQSGTRRGAARRAQKFPAATRESRVRERVKSTGRIGAADGSSQAGSRSQEGVSLLLLAGRARPRRARSAPSKSSSVVHPSHRLPSPIDHHTHHQSQWPSPRTTLTTLVSSECADGECERASEAEGGG